MKDKTSATATTNTFVETSTWILEHSDGYIQAGWRILSSVAAFELVAAVFFIAARALVGDTTNAATKYDCAFVLHDKFLVPYPNPLFADGTCSESSLYLDRGNDGAIVCIIAVLLSVVLDLWTPVKKEEHGLCECTRLNAACGQYLFLCLSDKPMNWFSFVVCV